MSCQDKDSNIHVAATEQEPLLLATPSLQRYYDLPESRIGYCLFLGETRHFGYYDVDTYWPFPINRALRAMEDHLYTSLQLDRGAEVLDAGCGVGHVAIHLALKGDFRVQGIDIIDHHIEMARRNITVRHVENQVTVHKMNYQYLRAFRDGSFDGVYTMETFVHATDPVRAIREFFRVLRPGGSLALYEYDHVNDQSMPPELRRAFVEINTYAAMPANALFGPGVLSRMLKEAGFEDVAVEDLSMNVRPMLRLFFIVAFLPYLLIWLMGLEAWFVNALAAVVGYRALKTGLWRYVVVTAKKPNSRPKTTLILKSKAEVGNLSRHYVPTPVRQLQSL